MSLWVPPGPQSPREGRKGILNGRVYSNYMHCQEFCLYESRKPGRETKVVINEHTGGCSSDCEGSVGLLSPVVSCEGAVSSECSECVCSSAGKEGLPAICESTW